MQAEKMSPKFPIFASFIHNKAPVTSFIFNNMVNRASEQNGCPLMYRASQTKPPALMHLFQFIIYNYIVIKSLVVMRLKQRC